MANLTSIRTIALAVTLVGTCLGRVNAVPSQMSHEMSGTVQRIDRQTLMIVLSGASKAERFAWNSKDTKFFRDGALVAFDSLRAGTQVQIRCSHPLIGAPLLYRVSWQTRTSTTQPKTSKLK
jgi:hypothetical protein